MKYYIIAGEASGDLHGSNLVREIKSKDSVAQFRGWGGNLMESQGVELTMHYRDTAFMGFVEVVLNLKTILGYLKNCKKDILEYKPDTIILIDYPGFNLRIARFAHENRIKVVYYISPQVWAWKSSRVYSIKRYVDQMIVILPFEKEFYAKYGYHVDFVGHPLLDIISNINPEPLPLNIKKPLIAILPGSRKQEITKMLPVMLSVTEEFPAHQFVIAGVDHLSPDFYRDLMGDKKIEVLFGSTYNLLLNSCAAMVTSGTATLETAMLGIPEVVCYEGNPLSYYIAKQLVKIKYISLVNLIMDREVVKELIQHTMNTKSLAIELRNLLDDPDHRSQIITSYTHLTEKLGGPGASARAAALITGK